MEEISLQLKWKYQFQFAGFIMAKEKGFYEDSGLDVSLVEFNDSIDTLSDVLSGKTHFAIGDASLVQAAMNNYDVVAMMAVLQESAYTLMTLESSNINTLEDMNGKKIALYEDINGVSLKAMLKSRNINYEAKPMGTKLDNLINKKVDVMAAYLSNEPFIMRELGLKIVTFDPKSYGYKGYGDILYTSKKTLAKDPKLVEKMNEASKKGWEYAFSHMDETVEIIYNKYNTLNKSKEALYYEAEVIKKLSAYGKNFGELNKDKLQSISHLYSYMVTKKHNKDWLDSFIYKKSKHQTKSLTPDEKQYLKNKKNITVCMQPELYPLDDFLDNKHTGMVGDIYRILQANMNITFKYIDTATHAELSKVSKTDKCDLISIIAKNQKRFPNFIATDSFFKTNFVVISKNNKAFLKDRSDFKNKKFLVRYDSYKSYILHYFPNINIDVVHEIDSIKKQLLNNSAYGMIDANYLADFIISEMGYNNVKLNGFLLSENPIRGSIGVEKSNIILRNILNKEIHNISPEKLKEIENNWKITRYKKEIDYTLLIQISILFFLLLILGIVWTILIQKKNKALQKAKNEISYLNDTLENRVKEEVRKNRTQQLLMLQQSRLAQMGETINMIAHQWKQPLNNLSLLTQTVIMKYNKDKLDDSSMQSFKENSQKQISDMSNVINDFRNFFKPEKDKIIYEISTSIQHALRILQPTLDEVKIHVNTNISKQLIKGYPNEIGQTLVNIINNAKDALIEKEIQSKEISISLIESQKEVEIFIEDNAGGIPEHIIEKIFDPYFSTKNEKNGTGLGLYMAKIIIEDHMQGNLSASNTDKGALFKIKFPKVSTDV